MKRRNNSTSVSSMDLKWTKHPNFSKKHFYSLDEKAVAVFKGNGVNSFPPTTVGVLSITPLKNDMLKLEAEPFDADSELWNGPNVIPDDLNDGSMEASLWHDLIWTYLDELHEKTNLSKHYILKWSNGLFVASWKCYSKLYPKEKYAKQKSWLAYQFVRLGAWLKEHKLFFSLLILIIILATNCKTANPPDWKML